MKGSDRASAQVRPLRVLVCFFAGMMFSAGCAADEATGEGPATVGDDEVGSLVKEGLFGQAVSTGSVLVTLHPGPSAVVGHPTVVSFGAPFPRLALRDISKLRALDADGDELPIHAAETLRWHQFPGSGTAGSIRAAMVSVEVTLEDRSPRQIQLEYGTEPSELLATPPDPRSSWVAVADGEYPSGTVREPRVYATFPSYWLSRSALRTRSLPVGSQPKWKWLDDFLVGAAHTAVNDVPDSVTELIDYTTDAEPWLFDRTATLFGVYVRTGDVKWLRHAHRSAHFYRGHVNAAGYFDLKDGDLKYSYGRSLLMDYVFTGDPEHLDAIERIAAAGEEWDPTYDLGTNFWTERHQTYALMAALSAWEATGDGAHADRVREIVDISFDMAKDPLGSWSADGCMLHGMTAHEGAGGDVPICSPWMTALFADAVWEYYIHSRDPRSLEFLAGLGHYVADYGLYDGGEGLDYRMPWYLSSSAKTFSDEGPWGDIEHTCDVAGLVARGAYAEKQLGRDPSQLRAVIEPLLVSCEKNLAIWHRPDGPLSGKAEWRVSPARKFNWWFGTTSDLTWLMASIR